MRRLLLVVALTGVVVLAGCGEYVAAENEESDPLREPTGEFEIHHIDVGQGDATLLVAPSGETLLIDSGDWREDGETVLSYLDRQGIDRIDHLVSTHAHADHIGGHDRLITVYESERGGIGSIYDSGQAHTSQTYERYLDAVEQYEVDLFEVRAGDQIPFGEQLDVTVLNPAAESGTDLHENSVTLAIEFGEFRYLTTGDAEREVEARLVDEWANTLDTEVYQAGHHGSSTSSSPSFLDAVEPQIAVISSATESQYGHPHDEVLQRFADRGVETYWTGVHGDVVVTTDGRDITVQTEHEGPTDPGALLEGKPTRITPQQPRLPP